MSFPHNADLHCHSVVSDGTLTPEQLAARARANGVDLWSLTDHDEVGGQQRALEAARAEGLRYLTGVEVSVTFADETVHIVGLGFDHTDPRLAEGLADTRDGRGPRAVEMGEQFLARVELGSEFLVCPRLLVHAFEFFLERLHVGEDQFLRGKVRPTMDAQLHSVKRRFVAVEQEHLRRLQRQGRQRLGRQPR